MIDTTVIESFTSRVSSQISSWFTPASPPPPPSVMDRVQNGIAGTMRLATAGTKAVISVTLDAGIIATDALKVTVAVGGTIATVATAYDTYVNLKGDPGASRFHQMNPCKDTLALPTWRNFQLFAQKLLAPYSGKTLFNVPKPSLDGFKSITRDWTSFTITIPFITKSTDTLTEEGTTKSVENPLSISIPVPTLSAENPLWQDRAIHMPEIAAPAATCEALAAEGIAKQEFNQITFAVPAVALATIASTAALHGVSKLLNAVNYRYFKGEDKRA